METTARGFKKPAETEAYDIKIPNDNVDNLELVIDEIDTEIQGKVDKVVGKGLSTEDYTTEEKTKLANIEDGATNYQHPASHPANMITQDKTHRFVTDTEKATWNGKESTFTKNTAFNKNFGAISGTVCQGNDSRLSNARTPTAHTHGGGDITSAVANATNADKVDGKHASAFALLGHNHSNVYLPVSGKAVDSDKLDGLDSTGFQKTTIVTGSLTYADTVVANSNITKTIALGGTYYRGIVTMRNNDNMGQAIIAHISTASNKAIMFGKYDFPSTYNKYTSWSYAEAGGITNNWYGKTATGGNAIYVSEMYINGTNLIITFTNNCSSDENMNCYINYNVW